MAKPIKFTKHPELEGMHSFLSPSGYHWLNYDVDKMKQNWLNKQNMARGTYLHEMASMMIKTRTKAAKLKKAVNMFVNDAIGFGMSSEVVLFYSANCFGTADAIRYDEESRQLKIFDLKTGNSTPSFKQLLIYAGLFCLEYGYDPRKMNAIQLRLYQRNGFEEYFAEGDEVREIMQHIEMMDVAVDEARNDLGDAKYW